MDIDKILELIGNCPHCSLDKGPVKMKYIGQKTVGSKYSLYHHCENCGHYYEHYLKGPFRVDNFHK